MVSCYHFVSTVIGTFGRIIIVIIIIIIIYYYQVSAGRHHRDQHRRMRFRACSFFHFFCRSNGNRWNRSLYNCWGIFALPSSFNSKTNVRFCDFREKKISVELQRTKEDREELDQQLKEAIHQKLLLSEQLEDWQVG